MIIIDTLKNPPEIAKFIDGHEKLLAFILSALFVVAAYIVALQAVPPVTTLDLGGIVLALMSWFTVARLSMALHDDRNRRPGSLTEPSAAEIAAQDPQDTIPATFPGETPAAAPPVPGDTP